MKLTNRKSTPLYIILIILLFIISCGKEKPAEPKPPPVVTNTAPTANFTVSPGSGDVNTVFTFDASTCADAQTAISALLVRWDYTNDGSFDTEWATTKTMSGTFPVAGTYTIKLEVKDSGGLVASTTKSIIVESGAFTDSRDGSVYNTITIDGITWMENNLAYEIPGKQITDASAWDNNTANDAWCYYDNISQKSSNGSGYGILYQWEAAKLAIPAGWHLPTELEITKLIESLGGSGVAGGKLKEEGTENWKSPNAGATNESLFTAIPGGYREITGIFFGIEEVGYWWTSTAYSETNAWAWRLSYENANAVGSSYKKRRGMSIRLVKNDDTNDTPTAQFEIKPDNGDLNTEFVFDASLSFDDNTSESDLYVRWDFDNDGTYETEWTKTKTVNHTFATAQTYTVKLQVEDAGGLTNSTTQELVVDPPNTDPIASFSVDTLNGDLGTQFNFDASSSSDFETSTESLLIRWDFNNDGSFETDWTTTKTSSHSYDLDGTYTVVLEVKDEGDLTNSTFKSIVITSNFTDSRNASVYKTVKIGDQRWFAENLNYISANSWIYGFDYQHEENAIKYGRLYNWEAAKTVCPEGWHLPSDEEFKQMEMFLGMSQSEADSWDLNGTDEGKKLKSTSGWGSTNDQNGTNSSGFNALPGGMRFDDDGSSMFYVTTGYFWSSSQSPFNENSGIARILHAGEDRIDRSSTNKTNGYSVRCVKD